MTLPQSPEDQPLPLSTPSHTTTHVIILCPVTWWAEGRESGGYQAHCGLAENTGLLVSAGGACAAVRPWSFSW